MLKRKREESGGGRGGKIIFRDSKKIPRLSVEEKEREKNELGKMLKK